MADDRRPPLETPEADRLEQERALDELPEDGDTTDELPEQLPESLEADPADALDQRRELPDTDDDYPPGETAG
ncbi:hypothetical protein [Rhodococcus sp. X156]|uniref:hypothetical protein n=1 Tax=Rhodococcus sp. X156 TaxID=2499145 RepID=UPI000FDAAE35|nr:hypothetical protein [Rhodococcus sp. X156]